jgi:hypothetical protein
MKIFLSFLPIIIAACVIGFGAILIIDDEIRHSKSPKKKNI